MSTSKSLNFENAGPSKDFSIWDSHQNVLRKLYVLDNMTLAQVKETMEIAYGFPETKECVYEVMLRDRLGLRKNLRKPDWVIVGRHVAKRRQHGKDSEVFLNGAKIQDKKVRKELRRYRPRGNERLTRSRFATPPLPDTIRIRTPPTSPDLQRVTMINGVPFLNPNFGLNNEGLTPAESGPIHGPGLYAGVEPLLGAEAAKALSALARSSFNELRLNCPIHKFLSLAMQYEGPLGPFGGSHQTLLETAKVHDSDQNGSSTANGSSERASRTPQDVMSLSVSSSFRVFGGNASLGALGRSCYILSNYLEFEGKEYRWLLDWVGFSADIAALRMFFSLSTPTVFAVWETLMISARALRHASGFRILVEVSLDVARHGWIECNQRSCLAAAAEIGYEQTGGMVRRLLEVIHPNCLVGDESQSPLSTAACRLDADMIQLLIEAGAGIDHPQVLSGVLHRILKKPSPPSPKELLCIEILLEAGTPIGDDPQTQSRGLANSPFTAIGWLGPGRPLLATDKLFFDPSVNSTVCYDMVVQHSDRNKDWITVSGIFRASEGGVGELREYIGSREQPVGVERKHLLEIALSEASRRHRIATVISLMELGVDPNASCLTELDLDWSPMIRAVTSWDIEMLRILSNHDAEMALVENVDLDSIVTEGSPSSLGRYPQDAVAVLAFIHEIASRSGCDIAAQAIRAIIRLSCRFNIDLQASSCLLGLDLTGDMVLDSTDLLQMAIRAHGDYRLQVVEFLIEKGAQFHSVPFEEDGRTMLHDALLGDCQGRREITEILLQHGANCQVDSGGLTILESSLQPNYYPDFVDMGEYSCESSPDTESLELFETLLNLGAPVRIQSPRLEFSKWTPLLTLLIARGAEDDLIHQVIEAGAALDEEGGCPECTFSPHPILIGICTPLVVAIYRNRFDLAIELINRGSDINGLSRSPLFAACEKEAPIWFLKFLIDRGADVNALRSEDRGTPLQAAAQAGTLNIAVLLLSHGADINALSGKTSYDSRDVQLVRALDLAALMGRLDMVQFLLDAGGRSAIPGVTGVDRAVKLARKRGNFAVVSVLEKYARQHRDAIFQAESVWILMNPQEYARLQGDK